MDRLDAALESIIHDMVRHGEWEQLPGGDWRVVISQDCANKIDAVDALLSSQYDLDEII